MSGHYEAQRDVVDDPHDNPARNFNPDPSESLPRCVPGLADRLRDAVAGYHNRMARKGRPQIGQTGFVWQVGMYCLRRDGKRVKITRVLPSSIKTLYSADLHCVCQGGLHYTLYDHAGLYHGKIINRRDFDLVKVYGWPKVLQPAKVL